jgi:hypothetical protein
LVFAHIHHADIIAKAEDAVKREVLCNYCPFLAWHQDMKGGGAGEASTAPWIWTPQSQVTEHAGGHGKSCSGSALAASITGSGHFGGWIVQIV